jgi:hypothetical protein
MIKIGGIYMYVDNISEEVDTVRCVGIDPPDYMGLVFCYFKAMNDNGSKNEYYHPVYGNYFIVKDSNEEYESIFDVNELYEEYEDVHNCDRYYKKPL